MAAGGEGVVVPAVRLEVGAIVGDVGIFLGAEEEHVLEEMGQALAAGRVAVRAGADVHGRGRLVELGVGEQEDLEAVGQDEAAVLGVVVGRLRAGRNPGGSLGAERGEQQQGGQEGEKAEFHAWWRKGAR